jgi:hypothetical protein
MLRLLKPEVWASCWAVAPDLYRSIMACSWSAEKQPRILDGRVPVGRIMISGPSTSRSRFLC